MILFSCFLHIGQIDLIFTHVMIQSKQKTCSQVWRKAVLSLTFSKQIGHSSPTRFFPLVIGASTAPPDGDSAGKHDNDASDLKAIGAPIFSSAAHVVSDLHDIEEKCCATVTSHILPASVSKTSLQVKLRAEIRLRCIVMSILEGSNPFRQSVASYYRFMRDVFTGASSVSLGRGIEIRDVLHSNRYKYIFDF
ncbi:hypothetical protein Mapa_011851 [Marchantia paleacea]|nr:hypothetical protein Mapa_011851 [Marchantia paleacea]